MTVDADARLADRSTGSPDVPTTGSAPRAREASGGGGADPLSRLATLCTALATVPVLVATARAIVDDWVPIGDNAFFTIRARDVLTEHHPWLGTWTSASQTIGTDVNNPGPLFWDVLALPAKIDGRAGLAIAVALCNIAAIIGMAIVARRQAGARGAIAATAAASGLAWTMGSELLFEPWQPHSLLLPFLCFLVMAWALACGDSAVLPWAVGLASLIVQTHIGYAVIVPAAGVWGVALLVLALRRSRVEEPDRWEHRTRAWKRHTALALVIALVAWAQPLYEQLFGAGSGNLGRLASSVGKTGDTVGWDRAPRFVADVVALAPWWGRDSMRQPFAFSEAAAIPTMTSAVVGLAVVAAVLLAGVVLARRRDDRPASLAALTGLFVLGAALVSTTTIPVGVFGVAAHHLRWLWPLAVFLTFTAVLALLTSARADRAARTAAAVLALATLVLVVLNVPSMNAGVGPSADAGSITAVRDLVPQLASLRDERGVLIEAQGLRFAEPYSVPVMAELQELGVPFFVDDDGLVRQLGDAREYDGDASVRLLIREGEAARTPMEGARRVAFVDALDVQETDELTRLRTQLEPFIADGGLVLNEAGRAARTSANDTARAAATVELDRPGVVFFTRALVYLASNDLLDLDEPWSRRAQRYADLQFRADRYTVAVFVEPIETGEAVR
ncbi:MAG TPA: hypothetical protein VFZ83_04810 [Acidimicrobiia bacterium]|nr:hypothetical protein [Acidimicrobiia bacterium]